MYDLSACRAYGVHNGTRLPGLQGLYAQLVGAKGQGVFQSFFFMCTCSGKSYRMCIRDIMSVCDSELTESYHAIRESRSLDK